MSSKGIEVISPEQKEPTDSFWTTTTIASRLQLTNFEVMLWSQQMRLLETKTKGGVSVFPAFQFVQRADVWSVLPGLYEVLTPFKGVVGSDEGNSLASWLNAPMQSLGGKSVVDYLKQDGNVRIPVALAQETASRWPKKSSSKT